MLSFSREDKFLLKNLLEQKMTIIAKKVYPVSHVAEENSTEY